MAYNPDEPRDAYGRWIASGNDFLSRFHAKQKEDARIAENRFKDGGGPGIKAKGIAASDAKKAQWAAHSPYTSVDAILASSDTNQQKLVAIGNLIAQELGLTLADPGPKSEKRLRDKVASGKAPSRITDATRAGFNVNTPEEGDAVVAMLAKHYQVADEGWAHTPAGYFDRKVIIRNADGMLGEVQLWPPGMLHAKEHGGAGSGHKLYEHLQAMARKNPNDLRLPAIIRQMRTLYGRVLDKLPRSWDHAKAHPS